MITAVPTSVIELQPEKGYLLWDPDPIDCCTMVNINNSEYIHVVHDSVALFSPTLVTLKVIYEIMFLAMCHIV